MTILIVEDETATASLMCERLKNLSYATKILPDGESCLASVRKNRPSLILLDYELPGLSGLEVLKEIRKKYNMIELPIIFVTSNSDTEDVVEALKLGANDYIAKPIIFDILAARIRTQLSVNKYYNKSLKVNELETINSMIVTYNHEINTPLTIILSCIELINKNPAMTKNHLEKITENADRISMIIKKINKLKEHPIEKKSYSKDVKMIKIDMKSNN